MKYCILAKIFDSMLLIILFLIFTLFPVHLKAVEIIYESAPGNGKIVPIMSIETESDSNKKPQIQSAGKSESIVDKEQGESNERGLVKIAVDDGKDDTKSFLKALNAYKQKDFTAAMKNFKDFVRIYPSGRYTERAFFLMAETYELMYSKSISTHFKKMTSYYQDAVNRFSQSIYALDAMVSIADLNFKMNYLTEALGYYNYALGQKKKFPKAVHAMIKKAEILILKKRIKEAKSLLENVFAVNPGKDYEIQAKLIMSKLLYEMNLFYESLEILSELNTENFHQSYHYPEFFLYKGNNFYQLGNSTRARDNLFRFYNLTPGGDKRHLILARIGDTYRDEKRIKDAVKIYQLALRRFPESRGAIISLIRLAEVQEAFTSKTGNLISMSSKEIYKKIIYNSTKGGINDSFKHIAMLKLADLYIGEGNYDKSLGILKKFPKRGVKDSLKKKRKHVLQNNFVLMIKQKMRRGEYSDILNIYEQEKRLFLTINSPKLFLSIAKAYNHMHFGEKAIEMFRKIEPLLLDREKPPGLLLLSGRNLFKEKKFKKAVATLNLLLKNDSSGEYSGLALKTKGEIYLAQKNSDQAVKMFYLALQHSLSECEREKLIINLAGILMRSGFKKKALTEVRKAYRLKKRCNPARSYLYEETGDIFLNLGYHKEAAAAFKKAVATAKEPKEKIGVNVKLAQCYWQLNKKKESMELYNKIASLNEPFWSNFAKECIEKNNSNMEISTEVE